MTTTKRMMQATVLLLALLSPAALATVDALVVDGSLPAGAELISGPATEGTSIWRADSGLDDVELLLVATDSGVRSREYLADDDTACQLLASWCAATLGAPDSTVGLTSLWSGYINRGAFTRAATSCKLVVIDIAAMEDHAWRAEP